MVWGQEVEISKFSIPRLVTIIYFHVVLTVSNLFLGETKRLLIYGGIIIKVIYRPVKLSKRGQYPHIAPKYGYSKMILRGFWEAVVSV